MSWRRGAFSTGEALVVPTCVSPCESVPEPRARRSWRTLVRAGASHPPAVLLNSVAHSPVSPPQPFSDHSRFPCAGERCTGCAWEKPGAGLVPSMGIAPRAFPSHSFCKAACPRGGKEVGKWVAGLPAEPFCFWETFSCLSQTLLFLPWESSVLEEGLCVL